MLFYEIVHYPVFKTYIVCEFANIVLIPENFIYVGVEGDDVNAFYTSIDRLCRMIAHTSPLTSISRNFKRSPIFRVLKGI